MVAAFVYIASAVFVILALFGFTSLEGEFDRFLWWLTLGKSLLYSVLALACFAASMKLGNK